MFHGQVDDREFWKTWSFLEIVGDDPVEFAEAFVKNHFEGGYAPARKRKRLINDIARRRRRHRRRRQDSLITTQHIAPRGRRQGTAFIGCLH